MFLYSYRIRFEIVFIRPRNGLEQNVYILLALYVDMISFYDWRLRRFFPSPVGLHLLSNKWHRHKKHTHKKSIFLQPLYIRIGRLIVGYARIRTKAATSKVFFFFHLSIFLFQVFDSIYSNYCRAYYSHSGLDSTIEGNIGVWRCWKYV